VLFFFYRVDTIKRSNETDIYTHTDNYEKSNGKDDIAGCLHDFFVLVGRKWLEPCEEEEGL
jgi:hypothetical protein